MLKTGASETLYNVISASALRRGLNTLKYLYVASTIVL